MNLKINKIIGFVKNNIFLPLFVTFSQPLTYNHSYT